MRYLDLMGALDRDDTLFHKADLLKTEDELGKRLGFIRQEYART